MKDATVPSDKRFEFKIDGEQLYAPRELMTVQELIAIALEHKVLDPVEGGYALEDDKHNTFGPDSVVDLGKDQCVLRDRKRAGSCLRCSRLSPLSLV